VVKVEVVSKDVGAKENGAKNIPLHIQKLNYEKSVYELEDHVGEMALSLNLLLKLGPAKRTILASFLVIF